MYCNGDIKKSIEVSILFKQNFVMAKHIYLKLTDYTDVREHVCEIIAGVLTNILDLLSSPTMGYYRCESSLWK